ncbi:hypothetical protein H4S02_002716 [Coemansia sp. RSA 2611]|nr:hypothetical protein H4S02_002716 [Coemansia sp. RSA 2611]
MFPDLPVKYEAANIDAAKDTLAKLRETAAKMTRQCANMKQATAELLELQTQMDKADDGSAGAPFLYLTLAQYADLTHSACRLFDETTETRQAYIEDLEKIIRSFEGELLTLPPDALDSDMHFVRLLAWESSPGLKDARLSVSGHTVILTLADFDELMRKECD